ncbi:MAG: dethiobiotin synthetase [Actinomycetota bacterium]|nr:dethiobiotin synthetase [Actinomycetota bacterium]
MTGLLVTGTGTGVGKTTIAAAVACLAVGRGDRVIVVKPAQTGEPDGGGGDVAEILRRAPQARGVELVRYPDPLSPAAAARRSARPPLTRAACVDAVVAALGEAELVLVEGAGGLLVHYDDNGFTIADVAVALKLPVLLVTAPGLGTLNSTALTLEAMDRRSLDLAGLVIGAWPTTPDLAERSNVADLEALAGQPLAGAMEAGAAGFSDAAFGAAARHGLSPALGGAFDASTFRRAAAA